MMRLIIPTYNRACQLELLLRGLYKYWDVNHDLEINIIYKADTEEYDKGYAIVNELYYNTSFIKEDNFPDQLKNLIKDSPYDVIGFLVDDAVMFRPPLISVSDLHKCVSTWDDTYVGFSLRLSPSTVVQNYLTGELQPTLNYKDLDNNIIEWNWKRYPRNSNFGYWFSFDGHWYSKKLFTSERILSKYFHIDRSMEHQLISDNDLYASLPNKMLACKASSVFVNTVNTVQTDGAIPAGMKYGYTTKQLNDRFLAGERISLESFAHQPIISCHEEFPLIWGKA